MYFIFYDHSKYRMDLIGYYARLVATLNPILTDIAPLLVEMLVKDFKFQVIYLLLHIYY